MSEAEKYLLPGTLLCPKCFHLNAVHIEDGCHFGSEKRECRCRLISAKAAEYPPEATARKRHKKWGCDV